MYKLRFCCNSVSQLNNILRSQGMQTREHLVSEPETVIADQIDHYFHVNMDQYAHWVATALKHNTSSWLHYNLAAMYWRYKGNPSKAMECVRRSVLHAPRSVLFFFAFCACEGV